MSDIQKKPLINSITDVAASYWLEPHSDGPDAAVDLYAISACICVGEQVASVQLQGDGDDEWGVTGEEVGADEEGIDRAIELLGLEDRDQLEEILGETGIYGEAQALDLAHAKRLHANDAIGNPVLGVLARHLYDNASEADVMYQPDTFFCNYGTYCLKLSTGGILAVFVNCESDSVEKHAIVTPGNYREALAAREKAAQHTFNDVAIEQAFETALGVEWARGGDSVDEDFDRAI